MSTEDFHGFRRFRSGELEFLYGKGQIRRIMAGTTQVLNSIYAAVRDGDWGTVPCTILEESVTETETGMAIDLSLAYNQAGVGSGDEIAFGAEITIRIARNQLVYSFDGSALTSFEKNRIGICVLHPVDPCRGKELEVHHTDATSSKGHFPMIVSPHQPFLHIRGMQWKPSRYVRARLHFEGDIFEMEDQRNWSDASFKTYSTPLEIPFPVRIEKGTRIRQKVTLITEPGTDLKWTPQEKPLSLYLFSRPGGDQDPGPETATGSRPESNSTAASNLEAIPIPAIGISRPMDPILPGADKANLPGTDGPYLLLLHQAPLLQQIGFRYYRADLHLAVIGRAGNTLRKKRNLGEDLSRIRKDQNLLGWPVELVLHFGSDSPKEAQEFLGHYRNDPFPLHSLVLLDDAHLSPKRLLQKVVPHFRKELPGIPLGGGTDAHFAELNRNRPSGDLLDFIVYSLCPQVHAFDDLTLVENLQSHADMVASAVEFSDLPVSVSPVTLSQRFNPVATGKGTGSNVSRHGPADERMTGLFGACWTLGCLKQLIHSGTRSVTLFETGGFHGILSASQDNPHPYPVWHLLREVLSDQYSHARITSSSHPVVFDALHLTGRKDQTILLANYTNREQEICMDADSEVSGISRFADWISETSELTPDGWKVIPPSQEKGNILMKGPGILKISLKM